MKAPALPPATRERLLESAITLMRRSGLSGAGINEIVRQSGAPKGSVYHFFPGGKTQIVEEGLALHTRRVVEFMDATLAARRSPGDKVRALFGAYARRLAQGEFGLSCPSGSVCLDLDPELEGLRAVVASSFDDYVATISRHFPLGNAKRSRSFAGLVLTAIEGAWIRGRAERSAKSFVEAGEWLARLVQAPMRARGPNSSRAGATGRGPSGTRPAGTSA